MIGCDIDDTHLCIRCSLTIEGLSAYIEHRKSQCWSNINATKVNEDSQNIASSDIISATRVNIAHTYETFAFSEPEHEPEPPSSYASKAEHGGKASKSLNDSYDLPYELGADVFFSSLQLQSVQSSGPPTNGKQILQPNHSLAMQNLKKSEHTGITWMADNHIETSSRQHQSSDSLIKAIGHIDENKKVYEVFQPLSFNDESPEVSEESEEEVHTGIDDDGDHAHEVDDDDDYGTIAPAHITGGKWKLSIMHPSPPVVPDTHTGGKWRAENNLYNRVTEADLTGLSHCWYGSADDLEAVEINEEQHPPAEYTKGKWIPGTKMQRLEYKEDLIGLSKSAKEEYWCNICCRRLKSKTIYENHLKTSYHLKRAEPEQQLEKAALNTLHSENLSNCLIQKANQNPILTQPMTANPLKSKRIRRSTFFKCELCNHSGPRYLLGKHLISHYHYRRMQLNAEKSLDMILDNIHSIVLQSPYQCRPCRFYSNTEDTFLQHWSSATHRNATEGPGNFWCSYCNFECKDNNQMRRHLVGVDHKEVILAINRSVPISISKKMNIDCSQCQQSFRYNVELRRHNRLYHNGIDSSSTASDAYQNPFKCDVCEQNLRSRIALQRHEKYHHKIANYFCSICKIEFNTPLKARQHRKTALHRSNAVSEKLGINSEKNHMKFSTSVQISSTECDKYKALIRNPHSQRSNQSVNSSKRGRKKSETACEHKAIVPKKGCIKCKDCGEQFTNVQKPEVHRNTRHPLLRHFCLSCGETFAVAQALGQHSRKCHPARMCSTSATNALDRNVLSNTKSWNCQNCHFSAAYESDLLFHQLFHNLGPLRKDQRISCPICGKKFRKHSLYFHIRQHTNDKIFKCKICEAKFSRHNNWKDHMKNVHKSNLENKEKLDSATTNKKLKEKNKREACFRCAICSKVFATKYLLKKHSSVHNELSEEKLEYICTYKDCSYAAASPAMLRIHAYSHAQEKIKCVHPNCTYVGKSMLHLKRHSRSHITPAQLYACDKCDFKTRNKGHIKRHVLSHTGEKPFQCLHCDFRCSSFDNLRKHVLKTNKHPGKFIYECGKCVALRTEVAEHKIFCTNSYQRFKMHLKTSHKCH